MKYKLKSKSSLLKKIPSPIDGTKASYALLMQYLQKEGILNDYINNLISQRRIASLEDVTAHVLEIMAQEGGRAIIDRSLDWSACRYPETENNLGEFWGSINIQFKNLHDKFREEVLDA